MEIIGALLLLLNTEKIPIIDGAITAILLAFTVVVGVALERLFTDRPLVDASGYERRRREVFYWIVLIIVITLAIRFLVGSYVHLHMTYVKSPTFWSFLLFLRDLLFLFTFGAFLVRIALSTTCERFVWWIMLFSAADVIWCVLELTTHRSQPLAWGWLGIGVLQSVVTGICRRFMSAEKASLRNFRIFVFLLIVFATIFCVDLWLILVGSGWHEFDVSPC